METGIEPFKVSSTKELITSYTTQKEDLGNQTPVVELSDKTDGKKKMSTTNKVIIAVGSLLVIGLIATVVLTKKNK